jgi:hypothetical protein
MIYLSSDTGSGPLPELRAGGSLCDDHYYLKTQCTFCRDPRFWCFVHEKRKNRCTECKKVKKSLIAAVQDYTTSNITIVTEEDESKNTSSTDLADQDITTSNITIDIEEDESNNTSSTDDSLCSGKFYLFIGLSLYII